MNNSIHVSSVSYGVSECDPIELHISDDDTRRLVFLPIIHNSDGKNGSVNGTFVYQRKSKNDSWERISNNAESLSRLKAGEGYRLNLNTDAVTRLIEGLANINGIVDQVKQGGTNKTYIPATKDIAPLLKQLLDSNDDTAITKELLKLGSENALRLNDLVLNGRIRSALQYWNEHKDDDNEETWQQFFSGKPWILALVCAEPIVILKEKMYVGGTNGSNKGGKNVDYAMINKQTNNTALLEIKTPTTHLLGSVYRGIYPPSSHLSGSVTQVQNYKYNLLKNILGLREGFENFDAANIPTYVLLGNTDQLTDADQKRSFELFRRNTRDTIIITFDEVFERLKILLTE